jgi:8-oxo-dGTP pyrophosphatase MutT (NUDIX family)
MPTEHEQIAVMRPRPHDAIMIARNPRGRAGESGDPVPERLSCPVDAYMLLERGGRLLMLRRAASAAYAPLLLCPPSGHVDEGEDAMAAAIRETAEETGIAVTRGQVRCAAVVHHRAPGGQARIGWFFAADAGWAGEPVNREPAKHAGLTWIDPAEPRRDLVAYTWAGLRAWQAGAAHAIHWQDHGSPVHYTPDSEAELTLLAPALRA